MGNDSEIDNLRVALNEAKNHSEQRNQDLNKMATENHNLKAEYQKCEQENQVIFV
jgi:hypothetical protein